jgi:hypothetical protein
LNTAFKKAAKKTNPALTATSVGANQKPIKPNRANAKPTFWANCGGLSSSSSAGAESLGQTRFLKIIEYGWDLEAKTLQAKRALKITIPVYATWASSIATRKVENEITVVIAAPNLGPRGSI